MSSAFTIQAAEDGLHISKDNKLGSRGDHAALTVIYGQPVIKQRQPESAQARSKSLEVHGIIGVLPVGSVSYLIAITGKEQVATISDHAVYTITQVIFIGLSSQSEAQLAIGAALTQQRARATHDSGYASDESDHLPDDEHDQEDKQKREDAAALEPPKHKAQSQSPAGFGQFAQKWFLRSRDESRTQSSNPAEATQNQQSGTTKTTIDTYRKRILRTLRLYLTSRSFFFSYGYDLSRSVAKQKPTAGLDDLCSRFSEEVFWNKLLLKPFLQAGDQSFAVPLIQGFVGQRTFSLPSPSSSPDPLEHVELKLTLISRRSTRRAGLRYLRRGVDEQGNVANNVETEQILSFTGSEIRNTYSYVQLRGSIPLFFSQSPYSFKPLPQMYGSSEENLEAFSKHFSKLVDTYGDVQVASLVDKHGTEATIGQRYEETATKLNAQGGVSDRQIRFHWFDFHKECSGMRFENVSKLISTLDQSLKSFGCTVTEDGVVTSEQQGVIRTNCMDCLDRTNVTQSAISAWVLQQQLAVMGQSIDLQSDKQSIWFNQLWADNGDAISKQYAGTAALKGDFTRTRKRNWTGALTDFSLTLNRFYNNIFGDYFLQTCIDYMLGEAGPEVFDNFEAELSNQDHALDSDRIRRNAIDVCAKIVLENADETFTGWTLSCPASANTLRSMPFEECVLLLTAHAVYFCRFDWKSDKVGSFERISLTDLVEIRRGTYITNALGVAATDEQRNVGFVLQYESAGRPVVRTNTRTTENAKPVSKADETQGDARLAKDKQQGRFLAFKIPSHVVSNVDRASSTEKDTCQQITHDIASFASSTEADSKLVIKTEDIISLAEAQKSTSYADSISYSLKKLIW